MTTQARKQKTAQARTEHRYLNAQGAEVKTRDEAFAQPLEVSAEALQASAKLELHNGQVTFAIEVKYNPNTYPHVVTGGQITSGICGAPWDITGGSIGDQLRLDAKRSGQGSCANTITIVGEYQNPPAYRGTYGFEGATSSFKHTTRYEC
ncbi:hypothetical protein SLUN_09140 [Streptomyces lunaelactis]|uniref:Uncharacterized protein n=1 Tax=Streptomyces lunaelactis TaxID=1535768 RepID=A0A2R4SZL8_9ACTN|nr:hypothetical protein [Streptomyces lunaelactis]AVZ72333.1 hypothetical protein SLUN_09140 [Streptomyces lunaelactis]NUK04702.1 hypothetical protein [Streptomyces lunaelactis]NUK09814.1 hypothetical protein [Streptomyces lunaelactis]NUK20118.1 hypothetical protein [Streptomyces lunaelactis]NUK27569.1 hypothetical protein [Streptomyces lunaelactis]